MRSLGVILAVTAITAACPARAGGEGRLMAETCLLCHTVQPANASAHPDIPALTGRKADELLRILLGFRDGTRGATLMDRLAKGYSPEQLRAIATELSRMGPEMRP